MRQWGASLRGFFPWDHTEGLRAMTSLLRRVLVLLCTAAAKIHPTQVVSVCYPVTGTQSVASAVCCGVSAHRTWEEKWKAAKNSSKEGCFHIETGSWFQSESFILSDSLKELRRFISCFWITIMFLWETWYLVKHVWDWAPKMLP